MNLPYLYLGYWVKGSKKMNYKAQYKPLEIFLNGKWSLLEDRIISKHNKKETSSTTDPVLNTIYLPDGDQ
jgi:arginine-tRNA-protein transferase